MTLVGHGSVARCLSVGCTLVTRHPFFKSEKGLGEKAFQSWAGDKQEPQIQKRTATSSRRIQMEVSWDHEVPDCAYSSPVPREVTPSGAGELSQQSRAAGARKLFSLLH